MNRSTIYYIVVFMLWHVLVVAQAVIPERDRALADLRSTSLANYQLTNYEQQAVLKLQDVLDYITIVGSHKYNENMRFTALNSVLDNFMTNAKAGCTWLPVKASDDPKTLRRKTLAPKCLVKKQLETLLNNGPYEFQINYTEIRIEKALKRQLDGSYKGQLTYVQAIKTKNQNGQLNQQLTERIPVDFVLKRIQKQFGTTTEEVWEIFFVDVL